MAISGILKEDTDNQEPIYHIKKKCYENFSEY